MPLRPTPQQQEAVTVHRPVSEHACGQEAQTLHVPRQVPPHPYGAQPATRPSAGAADQPPSSDPSCEDIFAGATPVVGTPRRLGDLESLG